MPAKTLYDADYNLWLSEQVGALQQGELDRLDSQNLIEELTDLGKRERRALESYLEVILLHLLKWQFQPQRRSRSWDVSIANARLSIQKLFRDSPSLNYYVATLIENAYPTARLLAHKETGLPISTFPAEPAYREAEILDLEFLPISDEIED
jgi:hypothetical protein